jgi:hypothetical protein
LKKILILTVLRQVLLLAIFSAFQDEALAKPIDFFSFDSVSKGKNEWFSEPARINVSNEFSTNGRHSFSMDFLLPVYYSSDRDTLFFFNPKKTCHYPWAQELNLGVGLRKIVSDSYIIGANVFYDKKFSVNDKYHYQLGYGFEYLSRPFDFRFNYYDPISGSRTIDDSGYSFGELSLVNWRTFEEPLEGFDLEFGFPLLEDLNTRFYIGGFNYDSDLADDVRGLRLRSETQIVEGFYLDLTLNNYENGESNFIVGIRISLPFDFTELFKGKGVFESFDSERSYLQKRLFERVVRDIDVQSNKSNRGTFCRRYDICR